MLTLKEKLELLDITYPKKIVYSMHADGYGHHVSFGNRASIVFKTKLDRELTSYLEDMFSDYTTNLVIKECGETVMYVSRVTYKNIRSYPLYSTFMEAIKEKPLTAEELKGLELKGIKPSEFVHMNNTPAYTLADIIHKQETYSSWLNVIARKESPMERLLGLLKDFKLITPIVRSYDGCITLWAILGHTEQYLVFKIASELTQRDISLEGDWDKVTEAIDIFKVKHEGREARYDNVLVQYPELSGLSDTTIELLRQRPFQLEQGIPAQHVQALLKARILTMGEVMVRILIAVQSGASGVTLNVLEVDNVLLSKLTQLGYILNRSQGNDITISIKLA